MLVSRAYELLTSISAGQDVDMTIEEQDELNLRRAINIVPPDSRSAIDAEIREIEPLTQRVRQQSREQDLSGPGAFGRFEPSVRDPEALRARNQEDLVRLEDLVGKKALLESLVPCRRTNSYLALTVKGRKMLTDLSTWKDRFGSSSFDEFRMRMDAMRDSMTKAVLGAQIYMGLFESPEPGVLEAELRGPALVAALRGTGPEKFVKVMEGSRDYRADASPAEDELVSTYVWPSSDEEESSFTEEEEGPSVSIDPQRLEPTDEDLSEALTEELPIGAATDRAIRVRWIQANMTLPDQGAIAWLAGSEYPVEEAKMRYDQIMQTLTTLGYQEDSELRSAAAILAGSKYPVQEASSRFADLAGELKIVFEKPYVAASMLAANSFTPRESMSIFREAVGVVSRANFFDDAGEIQTLGLLLTNKITPDFVVGAEQSVAGTAGTTQDVIQQIGQRPFERETRPVSWDYWYYWNSRYYSRPLIYHYRTHPGHMRTVPYFG